MNSSVFDTEDIFQVKEGMIGFIGVNQAFVFRYTVKMKVSEFWAMSQPGLKQAAGLMKLLCRTMYVPRLTGIVVLSSNS